MKIYKISLFALLLLTFSASAQDNNTSPFSRYGLGDLQSLGYTHHIGMGGLTLPIADFGRMNADNPATYSFIRKPAFDVAFYVSERKMSDGINEVKSSAGNFRHFGLGIPIGKRWGGAFGLSPYSTVGYNITTSMEDEELGAVKSSYIGSGGINKVFLGTSYSIIDKDSSKLSLGVNASYLFGNIEQTRRSIFENSSGAYNTRIRNSLIVTDLTYDFGMYYSGYLDAKRGIKFHAGATFNAPVELRSKKDMLAVSYITQNGLEFVKDTLEMIDSVSGNVDMPQKLAYGFAVEFKDQFLVGLQYETQAWSNYQERFSDTISNTLTNSQMFRLGMRYRPKKNLSQSAKVWNRAEYRLGFRTSDRYIRVGDASLNERAVSIGLGLPMARNTSRFNFGIEFGGRGSVESNLLEEKFVNVFVGFSLSPQGTWFSRRKYD